MEKIFLVDFAGTLIRIGVIDAANELRSSILKRGLPTTKEHANPEVMYKMNRELVGLLTGLKSDSKVKYRKNDLEDIELTGSQVQNQMATNLFQFGMYMAAKEFGKEMVPFGFVEQLQRIKSLGYKLAIVSGVRTDIISGMLEISGIDLEFDYILGQPPILGVSNEENIKGLKGKVEFVIGDKMSDLEAGKLVNAKTIFVKWGHASGGEEEFADFVVEKPEELEKII